MKIIEKDFYGIQEIILQNTETGEEASILPDLGAKKD